MNNTISKDLRDQAVRNGLCADWQSDWQSEKSLDELCEMFVEGIKFCAYHRYPTAEYIVRHFGDKAVEHEIYANRSVDLHNPKRLIAKGNTRGVVVFDKYNVGTVHVMDESNIEIRVMDDAVVTVFIYNDAYVNIIGRSSRTVHIHHYGGDILYGGNAEIRPRTYNKQITG